MWLENDLVILPTNKKETSAILLGVVPNVATLTKDVLDDIHDWMKFGSPIHLFVLSNEIPEKGDFVLVRCSEVGVEEVRQIVDYYNEQFIFDDRSQIHMDYCKKVIATTDKSLKVKDPNHPNILPDWNLLQIPETFIEYFISEYNKGNIITKVMVEYEELSYQKKLNKPVYKGFDVFRYHETIYYNKLKINSDNTINIKPTKISKYEDLYKAIDKIKEGHKGSAINFIERFINTQID